MLGARDTFQQGLDSVFSPAGDPCGEQSSSQPAKRRAVQDPLYVTSASRCVPLRRVGRWLDLCSCLQVHALHAWRGW